MRAHTHTHVCVTSLEGPGQQCLIRLLDFKKQPSHWAIAGNKYTKVENLMQSKSKMIWLQAQKCRRVVCLLWPWVSRRPLRPHAAGQAARWMGLWHRSPFFLPELAFHAHSSFCSQSAAVWPDFQAEWRAFLPGPWSPDWTPYPALTVKGPGPPSLVWPAPALSWPPPWAEVAVCKSKVRWGRRLRGKS